MVVASCYGLSCRKHSLLHRPGASDPVKAVTPEYSLMFNSKPVFTGLPCATYRTAVPAPQAIYGLQGSQQQTSTLVKNRVCAPDTGIETNRRCHPWEDKKQ